MSGFPGSRFGSGAGPGGSVGFADITGDPEENVSLAAALDAKLGLNDVELRFDASCFIPRTTNGCGITSLETATNRINRDALAFDAATNEFAQVWFTLPLFWSTFTVTFFWQATSGTGSAVFGAQARIFNDGDAVDGAFGTAQTVTDAASSADTQRQTSATAAVTAAGTLTARSRVCLQIYRDAAAGGDTLAVDALVTGILLQRAS